MPFTKMRRGKRCYRAPNPMSIEWNTKLIILEGMAEVPLRWYVSAIRFDNWQMNDEFVSSRWIFILSNIESVNTIGYGTSPEPKSEKHMYLCIKWNETVISKYRVLEEHWNTIGKFIDTYFRIEKNSPTRKSLRQSLLKQRGIEDFWYRNLHNLLEQSRIIYNEVTCLGVTFIYTSVIQINVADLIHGKVKAGVRGRYYCFASRNCRV